MTNIHILPASGAASLQWTDRAACAEVDPELWYPETGQNGTEAKKICARCPVKGECLADALARDERFGIRGGLSERERRRLRSRRAA